MISILFLKPTHAVEVIRGCFRYSTADAVRVDGKDVLWNHESDAHFCTGAMISHYKRWRPLGFDVFVVRQGSPTRTAMILIHELFHIILRLVYGPSWTGNRIDDWFDEVSRRARLFWLTYLSTTKNPKPLAYCEHTGCEDFS